nr:MAG TPA: hypothetical protein [Caudoviricetes sp.]
MQPFFSTFSTFFFVLFFFIHPLSSFIIIMAFA